MNGLSLGAVASRCHPTLRTEAPSGARWVHEIKFDGYHRQALLSDRFSLEDSIWRFHPLAMIEGGPRTGIHIRR